MWIKTRFHVLKELSSKFLSLLRYAPYITDENPKIQ